MWPPLLLSLSAAAPLAFDAALALAEERPEVAGAREALAARQALAARTSSALNPTLSVSPGVRWLGTQATVDTSLQLSQGFVLGALSSARREALGTEAAAAGALLSVERRRARQETARAWLETYAAQEVLTLLGAELRRASDFAATLERAAARGGPTRADVASAIAWAAEARLLELDAEGAVFSAGLGLAAAVGAPEAAPLTVTGALPGDESHGAGDGDAEQRLALAQAGAESARLAELTAQRSPVLTVHASGGREGTGDVLAGLGVSLTLPVFDRGERERAPQAAQAVEAEARARRAALTTRLRRVEARHELEHSTEVLGELSEHFVPALERSAGAAQRLLEAGEGDAQGWLLAQRALTQGRVRRVRALADRAWAAFQLSELGEVAR